MPFLGVKEGEAIEVHSISLSDDEKPKQVIVTIYADAMVEKGVIRVSPEDIAKLAVAEGDMVNVQRKVPITEYISKKVGRTGKAVQEGAGHMGESIEKGAKEVGAKIMPGNEKNEPEPKPEE
ncbi:hypothetical protein JCM10550A_09690 [Methanogenium cariaci]